MSKCRDCGAELVWGQYQGARIPLDPAVPVYGIAFGGGTPTLERLSQTPGMPHVGLADHRRVCRGRAGAKKPAPPAREEE